VHAPMPSHDTPALHTTPPSASRRSGTAPGGRRSVRHNPDDEAFQLAIVDIVSRVAGARASTVRFVRFLTAMLLQLVRRLLWVAPGWHGAAI
jgi:hypothetical protein